MDFTAIDFETANRRGDSACQLAAVVVRQGEIVDQKCWLIRPRPFFFSRFNIQVHGIQPEDVENELEFGSLWPEIQAFLGQDCLVAHNASFDIKVLTDCLQTHRLAVPEIAFTCTRLIAKQTWPQWGRYGLKPTSDRLGIRFRHHDALEDSIACAKVLLAASNQRQCATLPLLEQSLGIARGRCGAGGGYQAARLQRTGRSRSSASPRSERQPVTAPTTLAFPVAAATASGPLVDVHRLMLRAEMLRSLHGKRVWVSGTFRSMSGEQVERLVQQLGGVCKRHSSEQADIWIRGGDSPADRDPPSTAAPLLIWSESEFLKQLVSESIFC